MEDIIYFLIMAAIMVGGAVSSANKKKKQREAATRNLPQKPAEVEELPNFEKKTVRKSLADILDEIAANDTKVPNVELTAVEDSYPDYEIVPPYQEGGRITEDLAMDHAFRDNDSSAGSIQSAAEVGDTIINDILGGEFDLRRAVIETEILNPKYKQY